jgi:hypothetical protein
VSRAAKAPDFPPAAAKSGGKKWAWRFAALALGLAALQGTLWVFGDNPDLEKGARLVTLTQLGNYPVNEVGYVPGRMRADMPVPTPVAIPASIRALGGSEVAVPGYMMPYDEDKGGVTRFLLVRSIMVCCFGQPPRLNEIILCEMPGKEHCKFYYNVPIRVYGRLEVGEIREFGQVLALYRLAVRRIDELKRPDASMPPLPPGLSLPSAPPKLGGT